MSQLARHHDAMTLPQVAGKLTADAPLAPLVWFKAGGPAQWLFEPKDADDLSKTVRRYFSSDLFKKLPERQQAIRRYANERYSWERVGEMTRNVYSLLLADSR